jgi:uncharacterized surface protein with fasciclin (FAS1) repeats
LTLNITGLLPTFAAPGTYTVFGPTDAAFSALGVPLVDWLTNARSVNRLALTNTLKFHALGTVVSSADIAAGGTPLTTLCASSAPACSPVLSAYNNAGTVTIKDPAVLATVLATVTTPNITCSNGAVHVVNAVLVPANQAIPTQNVAAVASGVPDLSSLVSALKATGLDTVLTTGNGIYTVFAPTNAAFAKVPLYISSNITTLRQVLLYHVITGRTYKENLPADTTLNVATLNGQSIKILSTTSPASVTVTGNVAGNKATVTTADVDSTNAVVHVIDVVSCCKEMSEKRHTPPYQSFPPTLLSFLLAGAAACGPAACAG